MGNGVGHLFSGFMLWRRIVLVASHSCSGTGRNTDSLNIVSESFDDLGELDKVSDWPNPMDVKRLRGSQDTSIRMDKYQLTKYSQ